MIFTALKLQSVSGRFKPNKKVPREGSKARTGGFAILCIRRRQAVSREREAQTALSVLVGRCCVLFFRYHEILRKIKDGGFDQIIKRCRVDLEAFSV